jgi:dihydrofolate reductase
MDNMNNVNIIVAYCKNNGIGLNNTLAWNVKSDMLKFKKMTIGNGNNAIIMGRNTYESIGIKGLVKRDNLILSTTLDIDIDITFGIDKENHTQNITKSFANIEKLEDFVKERKYDEIWIIGGAQIYNYFLNEYPANNILGPGKIFVTYIDAEFECDTYFPQMNRANLISSEIHEQNLAPKQFTVLDQIYINNA